jgi:hypothetical protein
MQQLQKYAKNCFYKNTNHELSSFAPIQKERN